MTTRELNRATLARQMLLAREKVTVVEAVKRLVAMQAQIPRPPFIGLWTRVEGFRREDLLRALQKKQVVRATAMRGTIHLMTAADYLSTRGVLQAGLTRVMQSILRDRLSGIEMDDVESQGRAFFARSPATFDALRTQLKKQYPKRDERALAYAVRLQLPLVQVPTDMPWGFAAAADFTLADKWLGKAVSIATAPADALVKRYLAAFGPATPADAQTWSGVSGLREVFEALRPALVTFRDERTRELFDLPNAPRPAADTPAPVRFLPEYDSLLLAHADRSRVAAAEHRPRLSSKNLIIPPTFLVDGFVAGLWKIERNKKQATLVLEPFDALPKKTVAALEEEGDVLLRFTDEDAITRQVVRRG